MTITCIECRQPVKFRVGMNGRLKKPPIFFNAQEEPICRMCIRHIVQTNQGR